MQGRITKVLNMKPVEILAMIEEAAGTRMFEDRRDKAFKTMAKKELKVQELTELLKEEIEPKLDKLRTEKRAFLEFQQTQSDLERMTRLVVAHDYVKNQEKLKHSAEDVQSKKRKASDLEDNASRLKGEISHLEEDVGKIRKAREKELRKGGSFQALEDEVKAKSHEAVRLSTVSDLKQASIKEDRDRQIAVKKSIKDFESQVKAKSKVFEELQTEHDGAKAELDKQVQDLEMKEELLQTLQTGIASKEGQESGYQGQLQEARHQASTASTEQEQAKLKITNFENRIKEDEPRAKKAKEQNSSLLKDLERLQAQAKRYESHLNQAGFEPGNEAQMDKQESRLQEDIRQLRERSDTLRRNLANVDFSYANPTPNFDRSKVKGLVASLFTLDKDRSLAGTALEICAGGRLYNVVVDTAETGTQLLQNGRLKKRVTIIPLNKIAAFKASADKVGAAKKLAPGKVDLALSLIGYDDEVSKAMDYVFGSTLVCEDAETAKRVTFDLTVRMKSVTLEGDVYDPSGTLSGGSSSSSSGMLVTLQELNQITKELAEKETALSKLQVEMSREKEKLQSVKKAKQELDLKNHEIKLAEDQISGNSSSSIIQAVEEMKENIKQLNEDIASAKSRQAEAVKDIKRIEKDMNEFSNNKDSKLAELQASIVTLSKAQAKSSKAVKIVRDQLQDARLESEQSIADLGAAQDQLAEIEQTLKAHDDEVGALRKEQAQVQVRESRVYLQEIF